MDKLISVHTAQWENQTSISHKFQNCCPYYKCSCETVLWDKTKTLNKPTTSWRSQKISRLRFQRDESAILRYTFTAHQRAHECSLRVYWVVGQHEKVFTDGGLVKECTSAVAETLLEGKQKQEFCDIIYPCQHHLPQRKVKYWLRVC